MASHINADHWPLAADPAHPGKPGQTVQAKAMLEDDRCWAFASPRIGKVCRAETNTFWALLKSEINTFSRHVSYRLLNIDAQVYSIGAVLMLRMFHPPAMDTKEKPLNERAIETSCAFRTSRPSTVAVILPSLPRVQIIL